jgi:hypothetical protein
MLTGLFGFVAKELNGLRKAAQPPDSHDVKAVFARPG